MDCEPVTSSKLIFSDLQGEEGLLWAKKMPQHSTLSFREGLSYPGYKDVDIAYVLCELDMAVPLSSQEAIIQFLEQQGKVVDVYRLQSGHCPNVSQLKRLAEVLRQIVDKM